MGAWLWEDVVVGVGAWLWGYVVVVVGVRGGWCQLDTSVHTCSSASGHKHGRVSAAVWNVCILLFAGAPTPHQGAAMDSRSCAVLRCTALYCTVLCFFASRMHLQRLLTCLHMPASLLNESTREAGTARGAANEKSSVCLLQLGKHRGRTALREGREAGIHTAEPCHT